MRELRTLGSVRGALSNGRPYRDRGGAGQQHRGRQFVRWRSAAAVGRALGTIHHLASGHKKERLEVFCAGRVLQLDNFRRLRGWGWPGFSRMNLWRRDKGQAVGARAFVEAVRSGGAADCGGWVFAIAGLRCRDSIMNAAQSPFGLATRKVASL